MPTRDERNAAKADSPLMTVPEAVSYLRTSRAGLYRMIEAGKLSRPIRRGGRALFARGTIERHAQREIAEHQDWELGL